MYALALVSGVLLLYACTVHHFRSNYKDVNELLYETENLNNKPFLKAHLKNGDVCIMRDTWEVDTVRNVVVGKSVCYDYKRNFKPSDEQPISIDEVLIFETNQQLKKTEIGRIAALTVLAVGNVVGAISCQQNPKACFGSCPTFYINENDNFHYSNAEGFSNAILPSMEYGDIDALNNPPISESIFSLMMKNEALETHCVNEVKLLAYPKAEGEKVYQSRDNNFYLCENKYTANQVLAPEGDITALVSEHDMYERFSSADEQNLNSRETIYLNFKDLRNTDDLGFIINFRQTLMTTYFIYSMIGYMGDRVGDFAADMERNEKGAKMQMDGGGATKAKHSILKELGDIDVYVWNEKNEIWELQGGFHETGPIAFNHQILPLKTHTEGGDLKLKIVLNKGLWRVDFLGLTNIKQQVEALEITPDNIQVEGCENAEALAQVTTPDQYLISMPGDAYKFNFTLPENHTDYELFLYSKGYYLEWMRESWIKEKNLLKLVQMRTTPKMYLKAEAAAYKAYELDMEEQFWNSKIDAKTFSYHEN